jgi:hypothetical protein
MADLSPIMTLFREWEATFAEPAKRPSLTNEEHSQLMDRCGDIENRMLALPSRTPADVAAKLIASTSYGGFMIDEDGPLIAEAKALVADGRVEHPGAIADPLLALVNEYRRQLAINDKTECGDLADEEALAEATFRPSYNRLCTNPPAATSYEGAVAAIRLVADEEENCGGQPDLTVKVLRAALVFLEGGSRCA